MTETTTENDEQPFNTTEDGLYIVSQPIGDAVPDSVSIRIDRTEYTFTDFAGVLSDSRVMPSVLAYETLSVEEQ